MCTNAGRDAQVPDQPVQPDQGLHQGLSQVPGHSPLHMAGDITPARVVDYQAGPLQQVCAQVYIQPRLLVCWQAPFRSSCLIPMSTVCFADHADGGDLWVTYGRRDSDFSRHVGTRASRLKECFISLQEDPPHCPVSRMTVCSSAPAQIKHWHQ